MEAKLAMIFYRLLTLSFLILFHFTLIHFPLILSLLPSNSRARASSLALRTDLDHGDYKGFVFQRRERWGGRKEIKRAVEKEGGGEDEERKEGGSMFVQAREEE